MALVFGVICCRIQGSRGAVSFHNFSKSIWMFMILFHKGQTGIHLFWNEGPKRRSNRSILLSPGKYINLLIPMALYYKVPYHQWRRITELSNWQTWGYSQKENPYHKCQYHGRNWKVGNNHSQKWFYSTLNSAVITVDCF